MKTIPCNKTARRIFYTLTLLALTALVIGLCAARRDDTVSELVTSREARTAYLRSFGWEVDADSELRQEILLPRTFDDVLSRYNALQTEQGFDLTDYAGLNASLYSYEVTNWPDEELTVIADLYVVKNRIVGGDIHSTALNGFMIGLR